MKFEKLFSPLKVGRLTLKNRIVTAPMSIVELDAKGGYTEACYGELLSGIRLSVIW